MAAGYRQRGFTLVELITVIVLLGALAVTTAVFLVQPFQAAADISRRAELVDEADLALARIGREVRTALPNSVRVTDNSPSADRFAVEFVSTRTGGRYRRLSDGDGDGETLTIPSDSGTFDVLGPLPNGGIGGVAGGGSGACGEGGRDCISVYNTGQPGLDIYNSQNLAAVASTGPTAPTATSRILYEPGSGNGFDKHSPRQRFFVVDDVVSFVCDTNSGTLRRRATYGLKSMQPIAAADFSGAPNPTSDLMARDVSACNFSYEQGDSSRAGLLTLTLTLERDGETVELLKQVHVMNAP